MGEKPLNKNNDISNPPPLLPARAFFLEIERGPLPISKKKALGTRLGKFVIGCHAKKQTQRQTCEAWPKVSKAKNSASRLWKQWKS